MKNPTILYEKNGKPYTCGDPFVMKWDGRYYLYPSARSVDKGPRVFVSDDLVNWDDCGEVAVDPRLVSAYAPEVIYHRGEFFMCTSPDGGGHYILKSKSPTGPFEFVTGNIEHLIDGTWNHDEEFGLRFAHAGINGISMYGMDDPNHPNKRKDLLPPISGGWTEGPTFFERDGIYYATYCGNHLYSTAYRVLGASSLTGLDGEYAVQEDPVLISTEEGYAYLGHNSVVIGPNLDTYYMPYHQGYFQENGYFFRHCCIDPIYFNKRHFSVNPCHEEYPTPARPDIEARLDQDLSAFEEKDGYLCLKKDLGERFGLEVNFLGDASFHVGSILVCFKNGIIEVGDKSLDVGGEDALHCLKVISGDGKAEIHIDGLKLVSLNHILGPGPFKILLGSVSLSYFAYSCHAFGSSYKELPVHLPGTIEASLLGNTDELGFTLIHGGEEGVVAVHSKPENEYMVSLLFSDRTKGKIRLHSSLGSIERELDLTNLEYPHATKTLGKLSFQGNDHLHIEVLEGTVGLARVLCEPVLKGETKACASCLKEKKPLFLEPSDEQSIEFTTNSFAKGAEIGIIFNAKNHSVFPANPHPQFQGYVLGISNDLTFLAHCQYGAKRVFDRPVKVKPGEKHVLTGKIVDSVMTCYLDGEYVFDCPISSQDVYGYGGVYQNEESDSTIHGYSQGGSQNEI